MKKADELVGAVLSIRDAKTLSMFFSEIFTDAERKDFRLRWELMKLLMLGTPQREIASRLEVSLCKITRGAKIIKNPESATRRLMQQEIHNPQG